jgi:hypothetical protein
MIVRASARPRWREGWMLALGAFFAMAIIPMAQGQVRLFPMACAQKEIAVITAIEEHGAANDIPSDRLGQAGLTMLRARSTCYQGRVGEALALYNSALDLGPVASLSRQRP